MDDYFLTKSSLFLERSTHEKPCIIGIDDDYGVKLAKKCKASGKKVLTVSIINPEADIFAKSIQMSGMETKFSIIFAGNSYECNLHMAGSFNIFNALMAAGLCNAIGIEWETIIAGLESVKRVPGRFETIKNADGFNVIVDYAHSPAAMENVLKTVRPFTKGRVITVFGCGGNRSHEKRPIMGKIAYQNSEITIVTSDNPRKENPAAIIEQIMDGIESEKKQAGKEVYSEADRLVAIKMALKAAKAGDTVVIAGKGHETGQTFADKTIPFDDREVVRAYFRGEDEI
jgi:UDP-N-acetylmuramoyl-L-alanyl-D-glutamate--2,6-diaminopimelate ligase